MPDQPTGTVTFLFTDVEDSTSLWEQQAAAMRDAMARHDLLVEEIVARHGGVVVRPRGEGDSRFVVFRRATDAVVSAAALQRALHAEAWSTPTPISVRVAVHTGEADLRDGDYYGTAVNRCARIRSLARGGQTLVSQATYDLIRDHHLPRVELRDLGEHRLRSLARPERVFQLVVPGVPSDFPPLRTPDHRPNNLPLQPTPFVGRERELEAVRQRLLQPDVRLLTLTGPGGTGKTRLALQAASELLDDFVDGVWFVNLAPIGDPDLVASAIASVLGIGQVAGQPLDHMLRSFLREKRLLLLLDNFEQVLPSAPLVGGLLGATQHLKVLVTSRALLGLYWERAVAVPPLALPDPQHLPPLEHLIRYEAIRLFVERAQAAKADFALTDENAAAVAEICARLDGLPLAIELACARIRLLPPQALLQRLSSRLKLLTGGSRDLPARQQTLRGAIEWSYSSLDLSEQTLFARLSVFARGAMLEAVEDVCGADDDLDLDVLDGLASLVDKSLLRQEEGSEGEARFWMLETIREYAIERLTERGERDRLQRRHAAHYLALAEQAAPGLSGPEQAVWFRRLETEHDNLRAALDWSLSKNGSAQSDESRTELGLRMAWDLHWFWTVRGHVAEGRRWVAALLDSSAGQSPSLARGTGMAASLAFVGGDFVTARTRSEQAIAMLRAREEGQANGLDQFGLAHTLTTLGAVTGFSGDASTGRSIAEQALNLLKEIGDRNAWGIGRAILVTASLALNQGDYAAARSWYEEGLRLFRAMGDNILVALTLNYLGDMARIEGDYDHAGALYKEALPLLEATGYKSDIPALLHNLGYVYLSTGDHEQATSLFTDSLVLQKELGNKAGIAECLAGCAAVAGVGGQPARAARLFGATHALREAIGAGLWPGERIECERNLASARAQLDNDAWDKAWAEGRAMPLEQAVAYALEETATFP